MGKRTAGLTGLSRFVVQAFQDSSKVAEGTTPGQDPTSEPAPEPPVDEPPRKKRKTATSSKKPGLLGPGNEKYDATDLVPYYTHSSEVPPHLQKYFAQRTRLFSLYSSGCLLDPEGWYSVTPELIASHIAERCRCDVILDAFCGVGGNAIAFAATCERVIALDTSPTRLALARHNAIIYGVADRIEFILGDYISFAESYLSQRDQKGRTVNVVFLSPPWGGPEYVGGPPRTEDSDLLPTSTPAQHPEYSLGSIQPIHGADLWRLSRRITKNVAYYLPRNTRLEEVAVLIKEESLVSGTNGVLGKGKEGNVNHDKMTPRDEGKSGIASLPVKETMENEEGREMVEVEEEWMGLKLKALTCYFGGLADGQEEMF